MDTQFGNKISVVLHRRNGGGIQSADGWLWFPKGASRPFVHGGIGGSRNAPLIGGRWGKQFP